MGKKLSTGKIKNANCESANMPIKVSQAPHVGMYSLKIRK
jgi:hypothetical protein